jgi:hypothetical protein
MKFFNRKLQKMKEKTYFIEFSFFSFKQEVAGVILAHRVQIFAEIPKK